MGTKRESNRNHLHGDTDEEEEVEFEETDHNLVPSIHCYGEVASDRIEMDTTRMTYSS